MSDAATSAGVLRDRVVRALLGAVAVVLLAALVLMLLLLEEMNRHVSHVDARTGVLEERIVGGERSPGPALRTTVQDILPTLRQVDGQLRQVSADTSNIGLLRSVDSQLGTLERNTQLIAVLPRVSDQLAAVDRSLQSIAVLPALLEELRTLRGDTSQLAGVVTRLDSVRRELRDVRGSVAALPPVLADMAEHLRNIDRKTGPAPPVTP